MKSECQCKIHIRQRAIEARMEGLCPDHKELVEDLMEILYEAEMDRDYYRALCRGVWPNSDEVIKSIRHVHAIKNPPIPGEDNAAAVHPTTPG
jgi:hypothetical protein